MEEDNTPRKAPPQWAMDAALDIWSWMESDEKAKIISEHAPTVWTVRKLEPDEMVDQWQYWGLCANSKLIATFTHYEDAINLKLDLEARQ